MNTQYKKNLKDAMTACKNYTDKRFEDFKWELGSHTLDVESDTTTAYVKTVPTGTIGCTLDKIGGMSYKYNQLVSTRTATRTITAPFAVIASIANCDFTHKFLLCMKFNTTFDRLDVNFYISGSGNVRSVPLTPSNNVKEILNPNYSGIGSIMFYGVNSTDTSITYDDFMLFDLTDMGIDTTDVATAATELLKRGIDIHEYNEYNVGTIRDTKVSEITTDGGINKFNKNTVTLNKKIDQSNVITDDNNYFISDYIRVNSSETYCYNLGISFYTCFYDKYKNFIIGGTYDVSFTTPANAKYMRMSATKIRLDVLMISKGSTPPSTYVAYSPITKQIPAEVQALEGYGWGVNDTCYNYIDYETKKFVQKVGRVDLGSLSWSYNSQYDFFIAADQVEDYKYTTDIKGLCGKYNFVEPADAASAMANVADKSITFYRNTGTLNKRIYVKDTAYTDPTTFKTAMSGVYLYYELATPVETDISEYIDNNFIKVEGGGTLTFTNTYNQAVPSEVDYLIEEVKA